MGKWLKAAMKVRAVMDAAGALLTDDQALTVSALYPLWEDASAYDQGQRVRYDGTLYRCLTAHTAQPDWMPPATPSLWARVLVDPSGAILPWAQPGSTNPYAKGDQVTHGGKTWVSTVDNNTWEPGVYGWQEVH